MSVSRFCAHLFIRLVTTECGIFSGLQKKIIRVERSHVRPIWEPKSNPKRHFFIGNHSAGNRRNKHAINKPVNSSFATSAIIRIPIKRILMEDTVIHISHFRCVDVFRAFIGFLCPRSTPFMSKGVLSFFSAYFNIDFILRGKFISRFRHIRPGSTNSAIARHCGHLKFITSWAQSIFAYDTSSFREDVSRIILIRVRKSVVHSSSSKTKIGVFTIFYIKKISFLNTIMRIGSRFILPNSAQRVPIGII